jgi:carboxyl-terminal processing protease
VDWDLELLFEEPANALNLDRVVIITTESTCSASELVINCLKPFIDISLIGDTTCGKPVGMYGYDFGDKHINFIELKTVNALNDGDYFDGIPSTCVADDDLERLLGDTQEASLKEALYYLINDSCSDTNLPDLFEQKFTRSVTQQRDASLRGFRKVIGAY